PDAVLRVVRPDGVEAVLGQFLVAARVERQLDRPVMREIDGSPFLVVEGDPRRPARFARLHEAAVADEIEVQRRIGGVTQRETPAFIEQQTLSSAGYGTPLCAKS